MTGHIQVYSCYSFQNSTLLIDDLCKKAASLHLESLAITDKDNMYGALEFTRACHKYGIKPVIGVEASIIIDEEIYPFLLLAIDQAGYKALLKITSAIHLNEEKGYPIEKLAMYKEHLFVISACDEGLIERLVLKELDQQASLYIQRFKKLFGSHYYIGLKDHGLSLQKYMNEKLTALAHLHHVKLCCSNEVRYLHEEDAITLDLLQASVKGEKIDYRHQVATNQKYLKDDAQMHAIFSQDIIENTYDILNRCHVTIETGVMHLPVYPLAQGYNAKDYLKQLCMVGLKKRFKNQKISSRYFERLKHELNIIDSMGFNDYFLIVFDYVRFAKTQGILVGPGRGSAAGSLVSYVLGITNIDPIEYDLLFERFLNPERVTMPDIDIDFQDERRDEVIDYIRNKYGQPHVGQLVAFSTYGPKVALKDLGKVVGVSLPKLEMMTKYIPTGQRDKKTVEEVYKESYAFYNLVNKEPMLKAIMPSVFTVEKLPRNITMHAAGVVLSRDKLYDVVPLTRGPAKNVLTQYSKDYIESVGLLKMDVLGLKNLSVIQYILDIIYKQTGQVLDLVNIPLDDWRTFRLLCNADTLGVFQLESSGMKNLIRKMQPDKLDDIVAALALFRPGPMANIPHYIARKQGKEKIDYIHEDIRDILEPTYGILIYQEQIMLVAQKIAGFSLAKADSLRYAISKKKAKDIEALKLEFIAGAKAKGHSEEKACYIYELIEKFADYGFNKSHSVAYSLVAYQLAYLKANYPLAFYSATLTNEQGSDHNKMAYIQEAKKYGIKVLPPSINRSSSRFTVENGHIRYALTAIKNVGSAGYRAIVEEREKNGPYQDIFDFMARHEKNTINSKMLESLIDAGAFDEFKLNRATIKANLDAIVDYVHLKNTIGIDEPPILEIVKEDRMKRLEDEKAVLGLYLSTHPLVHLKEKYRLKVVPVASLQQFANRNVQVFMQISRVKVIVDKKGQEMCFVDGYDESGEISCVCFASTYSAFKNLLTRNALILVEGRVDTKNKLSFIINNVAMLEMR